MTDTRDSVIAFLINFNKWRRGDEDIKQPDPKEIGENIDAAIKMLTALQAGAGDAQDAARYRFLRSYCTEGYMKAYGTWNMPVDLILNCDEPEKEWDASIDAQILNLPESAREHLKEATEGK